MTSSRTDEPTPARAPLPLLGTGLVDPYVGAPGYDGPGRWTHADHYVADDDPDAPTARAARPRPAAHTDDTREAA